MCKHAAILSGQRTHQRGDILTEAGGFGMIAGNV
jgi:hypothetical protein